MFCGDLVNDVVIVLLRNTVSFRFLPLRGREEREEEEKGKGKEEEEEHVISTDKGIMHDLLHFQYLVAMLMNRFLRRNRRQRDFVLLPIDFHFFFFQVFLSMTNVQVASQYDGIRNILLRKRNGWYIYIYIYIYILSRKKFIELHICCVRKLLVKIASKSRFVWLKFRGFDIDAVKPSSKLSTKNRLSSKQPTDHKPSLNQPTNSP
jgi:hypothetical protein